MVFLFMITLKNVSSKVLKNIQSSPKPDVNACRPTRSFPCMALFYRSYCFTVSRSAPGVISPDGRVSPGMSSDVSRCREFKSRTIKADRSIPCTAPQGGNPPITDERKSRVILILKTLTVGNCETPQKSTEYSKY